MGFDIAMVDGGDEEGMREDAVRLGKAGRQLFVFDIAERRASSAMSGDSAATAATFSPMKRTLSRARIGISRLH